MENEEANLRHRAEMRHQAALQDAASLVLQAWLYGRAELEAKLKDEAWRLVALGEVGERLFGEQPLAFATGLSEGLVQVVAGLYLRQPAQEQLTKLPLAPEHLLAAIMMAAEVVEKELHADRGVAKHLADYLHQELVRMLAAQAPSAVVQKGAEGLKIPAAALEHHMALMAEVGAGLDRMQEVQAALSASLEVARQRLSPSAIAGRAAMGAPIAPTRH